MEYPEILKINNQEIITSFLRGLFDTDGNIDFKSKYGYKQYYPVISICLISKKVINEVSNMLIMLGFKPCTYIKGKYGLINLNGIAALKRYEKLIGWRSLYCPELMFSRSFSFI
mgnify:CR=1 FL=1